MTTITIRAQHLDGNFEDGFRHEKWLEFIAAEYRGLAAEHFPGADITVDIDRQRNCSGYTRPVSVFSDAAGPAEARLEEALQYVANELFSTHAVDFFSSAAA